jgi:hypothetical protein
MKKSLLFSLFLVVSILITGCASNASVQVTTPGYSMQLRAPGPNPMINQPDGTGLVARAGAGLWHGLIAPITLVLSFFDPNVRMYEVHNAGTEYDFGFMIGLTLIFALLGLFVRMRR